MDSPHNNHHQQRFKLQADTAVGFVSFFAVLALIQAIYNLFLPEPRVWPALLAGVLVIADLCLIRWKKQRFR